MRYRDASHVDTLQFLARRPREGRWFRLLGYIGILCVLFASTQPTEMAQTWLFSVLGILLFLWLLAWYLIVGGLWRSSIVAAIVLNLSYLTLLQLSTSGATP